MDGIHMEYELEIGILELICEENMYLRLTPSFQH